MKPKNRICVPIPGKIFAHLFAQKSLMPELILIQGLGNIRTTI